MNYMFERLLEICLFCFLPIAIESKAKLFSWSLASEEKAKARKLSSLAAGY